MSEMLALMDGHQPCLLFEQAFLEQMPDDIRLRLAGSDFTDPLQLAERADELLLSKQQDGCSISRVSVPSSQRPRRAVPPQDDFTGSQSTAVVRSKCQWCYYHLRWAADARQFRDPCSFSGNALAYRQ